MARKPKLTEARSVARFRAWLTANGAEVLATTNPYEVVRFRSGAGVGIIYRNERGRPHKVAGDGGHAWAAFVRGEALDLSPAPPAYITDETRRVPAMSDAALLARAEREPITIAFLMQHDEMPMRDASRRLFGLERAGRVTRLDLRSGEPLRWVPSARPLTTAQQEA